MTNCSNTTNIAYISYNSYYKFQPLSDVSCSDGSNGLITKGYTTLESFWPNVSAWSSISYNSPKCGQCVLFNDTVKAVLIDECGVQPGFSDHFDVSPFVFQSIFGSLTSGTGSATFSIVNC